MLRFLIECLHLQIKQERLRHKVILNSSKITIGKIISVYGLKGWFKIRSYTETAESILNFKDVFLTNDRNSISVTIDNAKAHNKGFVIHLNGIDNPEKANLYCNYKIQVDKNLLPSLKKDEFYWFQLEGLKVINQHSQESDHFGVIDSIFETGANDVLVVKREKKQDILVPYILGDVIKDINLNERTMTIDWVDEK